MKKLIAIITVLVLCLSLFPMALAADDGVTLYLKPNSNWLADGARFALYTWDGGDQWFNMTDSDSDGYYEVTIPTGISNIIFCRMNPSTTANNWNNKWNQTADLKVPTDGTNTYTVKDGTWDKGGGTWSVLGSSTPVDPEPSEPVYVVAGEAGLCGSAWAASDETNEMTKNSDGTYSKTYKNVPAGSYKFKIVQDGGIWIPDGMGNDKVVNNPVAGDVTITFNPTDESITIEDTSKNQTGPVYYVAGNTALCTSDWAPMDVNNQLTKNSDGTYSKTYEGLEPKTEYKFKITDGTWDNTWPAKDVSFAVAETADVTITFNPADGSVTLSDNTIPFVADLTGTETMVVAGSAGLCGSEWDNADTANQMTNNNGVYTITYTDVAAGDYLFKVVISGSWDVAFPADNYSLHLDNTSDVTITFNSSDKTIDVKVVSGGVVVPDKYVVAGTSDLCGTEWDPSLESNLMTENEGIYTITYTGVPAGQHEFKVVKNGDWNAAWPGENYILNLVVASDVTISFNSATGAVSVDAPEKYVVVGSETLCGTEWDMTNSDNLMTETSNGVYSITYSNVAVGDYELKVVENGGAWVGGTNGSNIMFKVSEACDVTVVYSANGITVTGEHVTVYVSPVTGDNSNVVLVMVLMVLSGAMVVALANKKRFF